MWDSGKCSGRLERADIGRGEPEPRVVPGVDEVSAAVASELVYYVQCMSSRQAT